MNDSRKSSLTALAFNILCAGLFVGTLDIIAALSKFYITTGKNPLYVFRYIASGIMGNAAFSGGSGTVLLGLVLHYTIALSFTLVFCFLYRHIKFCARHRVLSGILYGVFIWAVMAFLVVPLSQTPKGPFNAINAAKEALILILMIGLPLAFLAGRFIPLKDNKQ